MKTLLESDEMGLVRDILRIINDSTEWKDGDSRLTLSKSDADQLMSCAEELQRKLQ